MVDFLKGTAIILAIVYIGSINPLAGIAMIVGVIAYISRD